MKRYKVYFDRLIGEFDAETEEDVRLAAQQRWGIQQDQMHRMIVNRINEDGTLYEETSLPV